MPGDTGITRGLLSQLEHLLRPLATRIANTVARAVVQRVSDAAGLQDLQLGVLDGEDVEDGERYQEYGFTSVPLAGAEAVAIFPNGDRGHPLIVAVDDRRHRPTGLEPGEVAVYNHTGAMVKLTADGDIEVTPAPGREILAGGGSALATKADIDALEAWAGAHAHSDGGSGAPVAPPPSASGTGTLKGG